MNEGGGIEDYGTASIYTIIMIDKGKRRKER
jgi:hypothetical protein